jgi:hypothetical protein
MHISFEEQAYIASSRQPRRRDTAGDSTNAGLPIAGVEV